MQPCIYHDFTYKKQQFLDNHSSDLYSFGISTKDEEPDLSALYLIRKLHKCPYKQYYIVGSAKCSTKSLSKSLTSILSAVKSRLQSYCATSYSRGALSFKLRGKPFSIYEPLSFKLKMRIGKNSSI